MAIFAVTEEMIRFDKSNQIRQFPQELGAAAKQTIEAACYSVLSTSGNYTRTTAAGDNDIGNNTNSTTFSPSGMELANSTLVTMKDKKSGRYLGISPDTLIVTPRLEFAAKQLLLSPQVGHLSSTLASGLSAIPPYGGGLNNPFRGYISRIIVSPWFGTGYQWCLMKAKKAVVYQEVDPLQLLIKSVDSSQMDEAQFLYDD